MMVDWPGGGVPFWDDWKMEDGSTLPDWPVKLKLGVPDLLLPAELFPPLFILVLGKPELPALPPNTFPMFIMLLGPLFPLFVTPPKALETEGNPTALDAAGAVEKLNEGVCPAPAAPLAPPKPLIAVFGVWLRDGNALLLMEKILPVAGCWFAAPGVGLFEGCEAPNAEAPPLAPKLKPFVPVLPVLPKALLPAVSGMPGAPNVLLVSELALPNTLGELAPVPKVNPVAGAPNVLLTSSIFGLAAGLMLVLNPENPPVVFGVLGPALKLNPEPVDETGAEGGCPFLETLIKSVLVAFLPKSNLLSPEVLMFEVPFGCLFSALPPREAAEPNEETGVFAPKLNFGLV